MCRCLARVCNDIKAAIYLAVIMIMMMLMFIEGDDVKVMNTWVTTL